MVRVKKADVAGQFYSADPKVLGSTISSIVVKRDYEYASRAVIAPHAALFYSGTLAVNALQYLDEKAKNIFIFAPAHRVNFDGIAVCDYESFEIPLGSFAVNVEIVEKLRENFGCVPFNDAFTGEHAIEVELPLLRGRFPDAKIVPLVVGNVSYRKVTEIVEGFWQDRTNAFVISSDLSHFHSYDVAKKIDSETCDMVENCSIEDFSSERACGATAIRGLIDFAAEENFSLIRIGTCNSGDAGGSVERVVGYGAWMLVETSRNRFLRDNFSERIISICRDAIGAGLKNEKIVIPNYIPGIFHQSIASFVTLEIDDDLRGCIGSIHAHRPLMSDLMRNAHGAAFGDRRFKPLTRDEFEKITIGVSLLSTPKAIVFNGERELLEAIIPVVDGIIIRDGAFQAVYLPSVWKQLPNKEQFLNSLRVKAGLASDHFSETFEAFKFSTEHVG
ncbi:MAG: AmmeMemoRadiSam system protein B [Puniceicoccales bacterium]|jgi:AmmeMemoRadiSam system protein B/AmmeMemoRadiSam system protein A|nr:AmmeMemoRadiSam system protein B [Puniceicoccales bacterium]